MLYEDFSFSESITALCLIEPDADINDMAVGRFWPAKLMLQLKKYNLNWGILTNGDIWRLYSTKSSRPHEDYVELSLADALEKSDESEYALFERFFHKDSFVPEKEEERREEAKRDEAAGVYRCRLDRDKEKSEDTLEKLVKKPLLYQVDEVLQYLCNGFIADTPKKGEEYSEAERREIFESAVKLLYRCLFFFYAEARRLLPSEKDKVEIYDKLSIRALCRESHQFHWGKRKDVEGYDLWQHLRGLTSALNDGDPEYGIMGYNGGLFDDDEEKFLGEHRLRNDFLSHALYLLAYVEPQNGDPVDEYEIPYADLEVRHLGELYENILEYNVVIADASFNRWMTKKGPVLRLASEEKPQRDARLLKQIKKGDVFFAQTALERKQTGSYYTPETLVRFLNERAIIDSLREEFEKDYRKRFNELIEQTVSGYDEPTRRGAIRSAVALIERFVDDEILKFKVCDPAMGSGHFLVNASNQMAGLIVELLAEIPGIDGMSTEVTSNPNEWRRLITRHCLYGVDLNPLAVNLARLSLWLNCFATDHRLTFIDHHLRCGNSLIGIRTLDQLKEIPERKKESKKKKKEHIQLQFNFDNLSKILSEAAQTVESITEIHEDDTDRQKALFESVVEETQTKLAPLADLFTAYLMDGSIQEEEYRMLFAHFAKGDKASDLNDPETVRVWKKVRGYASKHLFFHWSLVFPEVFIGDEKCGFDATVGNPPWDILKPNSQEFFSAYDPHFRKYKKQEAIKVSKRLMEENIAIRERWESYCESLADQSIYVRELEVYKALGKGDINTYKLFLERFFEILGEGGRMGILVPSGIYTDQGCLPLRELFFEKSRIRCLYCFENRRGIFNIHRSFKFVLFNTQKGFKTDAFRCAFMEHDPERLRAIDSNALVISLNLVKQFAPLSLNLLEFNKQQEIQIAEQIYSSFPPLGKKNGYPWIAKFTREIDNMGDMRMLNQVGTGLPLYEGKMIHQFDHEYSLNNYWINDDQAYKSLKKSDKQEKIDADFYRLANRRQARSTDIRTMIACILPPKSFTWDNLAVAVILDITQDPPKKIIKNSELCFLEAIFNSFVFDFLIGMQTNSNLSFFIVYSIPVPRITEGNLFFDSIVARVARLTCVNQEFSNLWKSLYRDIWNQPDFWYPPNKSIVSYGPAHEKEIRQNIINQIDIMSMEWSPNYRVDNRTADRRDTGDRAQLRAEIDAYVAHLYGLSRDDFSYILNTFPALKRKEEHIFGEFMSKRKCLEEYDRIASIL